MNKNEVVINRQDILKERFERYRNWIGVIDGSNEQNRSCWALSLCEHYFPGFNPDKNIVFTAKDWLERFHEIYDKDPEKKEILLFDGDYTDTDRHFMSVANHDTRKIVPMTRASRISTLIMTRELARMNLNIRSHFDNYIHTLPVWQDAHIGARYYNVIYQPNHSNMMGFPRLKLVSPRIPVTIQNSNTMKTREETIKISYLWFNLPSRRLFLKYQHLNQQARSNVIR